MGRDLVSWLLDSDPALRWQVERDLLGADESTWRATRARVGIEGMAAQLLSLQDPDGQWAGGAFFPKDFDFEGPEAAPGAGQPFTATTWSLNSLREWGVDPALLGDTSERLERNCVWEYEQLPYWDGEVDVCINSWTLSNGIWLGRDMSTLAQWFVDHQLADGGWNCEWVEGSIRSSFDSTLNALKGLLDFEIATGGTPASRAARRRGEEYLLSRKLMYRASSGELVAERYIRFAAPLRWFYNVLNAADYFRRASIHDGTAPDPRMADGIAEIERQRQPNGTWLQARRHPGRVWFEEDAPAGEASKWLTLMATRILVWWQQPR